MLSPPPMDSIAVEKQLKSADALAILVSSPAIDAANVDGSLARQRLQQNDARALLLRHAQPDARIKSFALAFVGLLCAMVIGFASEIRPLKPDSPDYGYDEALGIETSSPSSANPLSNCSSDSPATAGASEDGLDARGVSAIAARAAASPIANFTSKE